MTDLTPEKIAELEALRRRMEADRRGLTVNQFGVPYGSISAEDYERALFSAAPALLADWRRMREALTAPLTRDEWGRIHDEARESYRIWARRATQDARPEDDMEHHVAQAMARAYAARAALGGRNER